MIQFWKKTGTNKSNSNRPSIKYKDFLDVVSNGSLLGYFIQYLEVKNELSLIKCWIEIENFHSIKDNIDNLDNDILMNYRSRIIGTYFDNNVIRDLINLNAIDNNDFRSLQQLIANYLTSTYLEEFFQSNYFNKYQIEVLKSGQISLIDILNDQKGVSYFLEFLSTDNTHMFDFYLTLMHLLTDTLSKERDFRTIIEKYLILSPEREFNEFIRTELNNCNWKSIDEIKRVFQIIGNHLQRILEAKYLQEFINSDIFVKYLTELNQSNIIKLSSLSSSNSSIDDLSVLHKTISNSKDNKGYKNNCGQQLFFGKIDSLGRFQTDLEPDPKRKNPSVFQKAVKKYVLFDRTDGDRHKEDIAWQIAEMIVKDVMDVTMKQS